jgi:hypothetical protein
VAAPFRIHHLSQPPTRKFTIRIHSISTMNDIRQIHPAHSTFHPVKASLQANESLFFLPEFGGDDDGGQRLSANQRSVPGESIVRPPPKWVSARKASTGARDRSRAFPSPQFVSPAYLLRFFLALLQACRLSTLECSGHAVTPEQPERCRLETAPALDYLPPLPPLSTSSLLLGFMHRS